MLWGIDSFRYADCYSLPQMWMVIAVQYRVGEG